MDDIRRAAGMSLLVVAATLACGCAAAPQHPSERDVAAFTSTRMRTFRNMQEFDAYRDDVRRAASARKVRWTQLTIERAARILLAQNDVEPCDPALFECEGDLQEAIVTGQRKASTSITNNQESDVDEGDIVKLHGRFLIVLQDGRLFSLDTGERPGALQLVDRIDVYSSSDSDTWYDELLIDENRLVVTGYNYGEGATEISVITIDAAGQLDLEARYYIESEDYYSGENYASRLVRGKFIVYTPVDIADKGPLKIPRIRSWTATTGFSEWSSLFDITNVYRPIQETLRPVLHVASVCDLRVKEGFRCVSRGIVGPWKHEVYVSSGSIYLWIGSDRNTWAYGRRWPPSCGTSADLQSLPALGATVFRMPIESLGVLAAQAVGMPQDQFAFDERDNRLLALLMREPEGCYASGDWPLVFTSIPLSLFGSWPGTVRQDAYTPVPSAGYGLKNRYSADNLVYSLPPKWSDDDSERLSGLVIVPVTHPDRHQVLYPAHAIDRVELLGNHAVIVGPQGESDLGLSTVELGRSPRIADSLVLSDRMETEGRSHAFNSLTEDAGNGLFGLPTVYRSTYETAEMEIPSDVGFFEVDRNLRMDAIGELAGQNDVTETYTCDVSCVDWYGNARPIFVEGRIFALTGSELIEGRVEDGRIIEMGRLRITSAPARHR